MSRQIKEFLNGVRSDGSYAYEAPDDSSSASWPALEIPPPNPFRLAEAKVDVDDLSQAGWALAFPPGEKARLSPLLAELIAHRKTQAGRLYHEPFEVWPGEDAHRFLSRHKAQLHRANPERMPYYLLLVGSPEQISFDFQAKLDQVYAVGRLHFDDLAAYRSYAASVVAAERRSASRREPRATFFGVQNDGDSATRRTTERLIKPLSEEIERRCPGWRVERVLREQATRDRLQRLLTSEPPRFLFSASHGMVCEPSDEDQTAHQGAIVCSDWAGPGHDVDRSAYLAGEDLSFEGRPLLGTVALFLACHSGGTPRWDTFRTADDEPEEPLAERPFVAALPQRLLAQGGASAVIAHADRAWTTSFDWSPTQEEPDPNLWRQVVQALLDGRRVGDATEELGLQYGVWGPAVQDAREARDATLAGRLWRAAKDVRSFVVLGDPAVKIGA